MMRAIPRLPGRRRRRAALRGVRLDCAVWRGRRRLVDDADALVAGRYLAHLVRFGRPVPPWAILNAVAHCELADLERWANAERSFAAGGATSGEAVALLARQLRRTVGDDGQRLAQVQRGLLIPFELALLDEVSAVTLPDLLVSVRALLG